MYILKINRSNCMNPAETLLREILTRIVDIPESVRIERSVDDMGVLLTLTVDRVDMGKIIGKEGATAKALRTILRVVGMRFGERINVKILDPQTDVRTERDTTMHDIIKDLKA